jgi:hypothetical protein
VETARTVELVICFECSLYAAYYDGKPVQTGSISPDIQAAFDEPLKAAKVPIAP